MQSKTLLTSVAALTLVFAGCTTAGNGSAQARTTANSFYSGWVDTSGRTTVSSRYDANAPVTTRFRNRLSALMNDNDRISAVLCGNSTPTSFDISSDVRMTGEDTATVSIVQHYATGDIPVQVSLVRNGSGKSNAWFIDDVNCGTSGGGSSSMSSSDSSMTSSSSSSVISTSSSRSSMSSSSVMSSSSRTSSSVSSTSSMPSSWSSSSSSRSQAARGEFCGGIAAIQCATGLTCQYQGTHPDAGGTCV